MRYTTWRGAGLVTDVSEKESRFPKVAIWNPPEIPTRSPREKARILDGEVIRKAQCNVPHLLLCKLRDVNCGVGEPHGTAGDLEPLF